MKEYNHLDIEKKWQKKWENEKTFKTNIKSDKPKYYALDMFPYPSGAGLHVGHPEGYTATDIVSRMKRMQGFEVLHPMGWDAFGLPAEQYAIKTGNNPDGFTEKNIEVFKKQIKSLGFSYDWDREINTTDPKYFKWTQWIFIQLYNKGLAELKDTYVNYCPECGTVLANEEVINGRCERGGHVVVKKKMKQWSLKITEYAERLLIDLDDLDWPLSLKEMQRNWIGKSIGAQIQFDIESSDEKINVFTTRADTIFGVTYVVLAPDSELAKSLVTEEYKEKHEEYVSEVKNKSELERTELNKDKTGMFIGSYAIHPFTKEKLPIWVADYVLEGYGTGAVMAVPAHDERDFEFAKKYDLSIMKIIDCEITDSAYTADGMHINSDFINGLKIEEAKAKVIEELESKKIGFGKVNYKLRDWLFSRQRYWGEPFPIAYMEDGSIKILDESELPVKLPKLDKIEVAGDGTSPLSKATEWLDYTDPKTGKKGQRETNTMPQWAGSCWYYIRYIEPDNDQKLIDFDAASKWLPVDLYIGGAEHAVLHLLYARFWHKVLYDIGVVDTKEPFQRLFNQGMILGENNEKMSKSKGNVVNPDDVVISHGADTLRVYEMFMGPLDASIAWSENGLDGSRKFLEKVWRLYQSVEIDDNFDDNDVIYHQTVKKVTADYDKLSFNTAISQMMIFINHISKTNKLTSEQASGFLKMLMPIAPHVSEEINSEILGNTELTYSEWPKYDESKIVEDEVEIVIQILGKIKAKIKVPNDVTKEEQLQQSKEAVADLLDGKTIIKEIVVDKKLTNFVVR